MPQETQLVPRIHLWLRRQPLRTVLPTQVRSHTRTHTVCLWEASADITVGHFKNVWYDVFNDLTVCANFSLRKEAYAHYVKRWYSSAALSDSEGWPQAFWILFSIMFSFFNRSEHCSNPSSNICLIWRRDSASELSCPSCLICFYFWGNVHWNLHNLCEAQVNEENNQIERDKGCVGETSLNSRDSADSLVCLGLGLVSKTINR